MPRKRIMPEAIEPIQKPPQTPPRKMDISSRSSSNTSYKKSDADITVNLQSIISVELIDDNGDVIQDKNPMIKYVNLPADQAFVGAANSNGNLPELKLHQFGTKIKCQLKFSRANTEVEFSINLQKTSGTTVYTPNEQGRNNVNFNIIDTHTLTEKTNDGGYIILHENELQLSQAGGNKYTLFATLGKTRKDCDTQILTKRMLFYSINEENTNLENQFKTHFEECHIEFRKTSSQIENSHIQIEMVDQLKQQETSELDFPDISISELETEYLANVKFEKRPQDADDYNWFNSCTYTPHGMMNSITIDENNCERVNDKVKVKVKVEFLNLNIGKFDSKIRQYLSTNSDQTQMLGTLHLSINKYCDFENGQSSLENNCIYIAKKGKSSEIPLKTQTTTLVHELAHQLGMVPGPNSNTYLAKGACYYTGKEHAGPHCGSGIPLESLTNNYKFGPNQVKSANCIMFGEATSNTNKFCLKCTLQLKKIDLTPQGVLNVLNEAKQKLRNEAEALKKSDNSKKLKPLLARKIKVIFEQKAKINTINLTILNAENTKLEKDILEMEFTQIENNTKELLLDLAQINAELRDLDTKIAELNA